MGGFRNIQYLVQLIVGIKKVIVMGKSVTGKSLWERKLFRFGFFRGQNPVIVLFGLLYVKRKSLLCMSLKKGKTQNK
ncbi:MAG TPA: hypothetical protein VGQ04_21095 [Chitinophagaceae bacterium]|nr:hypothetical protein [Chitinophagaceae bacterium]